MGTEERSLMYEEFEEAKTPGISHDQKVAIIQEEERVIKEQLDKELKLGTQFFFWLANDLIPLKTSDHIWTTILGGFNVITQSTDQIDILREFIKEQPLDGTYN